jgi:hypothetical protein
MHFGFAFKPGNTLAKGTSVGPHRLAQGLIGIKNGSKPEGQYGPLPEANANHTRMLENVLFPELSSVPFILANHYVEFSAGITED